MIEAIVQDEQTTLTNAPTRDGRAIAVRLTSMLVSMFAVWSVVDLWCWSLTRLTTTGCEEEALFGIWKYVTGAVVYADPSSPPFAVSYFNWLFFTIYGSVAKIMLVICHLDISALPLLSRAVTLGFAAAAIGILYAILTLINAEKLTRLARLACSILLVINPLTGPWIVTARPDIAAVTCELVGLFFALRYVESQRMRHLLGAVLAGYAAWAFKQNFIHLLGALFLFLLLRRQWRAWSLMSFTALTLAAGTLLIGGANFRHALLGSQANCSVSAEAAWKFFQMAAVAAPQIAAVVICLAVAALWRKRWPASPQMDLLALLTGIALVIGFAGASKQGASNHYFIPVSIFGVLWGISFFRSGSRTEMSDAPLTSASIARWAIVVTFLFGAAVGLWPHARKATGQIAHLLTGESEKSTHDVGITRAISQLQQHLNELPGPTFITDRACNLPWIQTNAPHFVYSFTYALDRKAGVKFERGGVGGLIEDGYFNTIVVLDRNCPCESDKFTRKDCPHVTMTHLPLVKKSDVPTIDGGRMSHYEFAFSDGIFSYYRKR